jgi:hypothetical protein
MIYRIETRVDNLEITSIEKDVLFTISSSENESTLAALLNKDQLYDLIGVLHSLQAKMKGGVKNG